MPPARQGTKRHKLIEPKRQRKVLLLLVLLLLLLLMLRLLCLCALHLGSETRR